MARKYKPVEIGDVYNELTVIAEDFEREQVDIDKNHNGKHFKYYKCRCSCGKETTVQIYQLVTGRTRSCGHLHKELAGSKPKDLKGKTFNYLEVLYIDDTKPNGSGKHTYWICKCLKCGNTKSIRSSELIQGIAIDCGCENHKRMSDGIANDLFGKVFGHLHVLEKDWGNYKSGGGNHTRWLCKCDLCGRIESNSSAMLTTYGKDRCKYCAGISMGEQRIVELLEENNIPFIHDKPYLGLKTENGGAVRFDFRITQDSDCDYMIEFDGEQHYRPIPMYDDNLSFEKRKQRDKFKDDWCIEHNIPMIRIPYTRLKKLNIDDLRPETTNYLVSSQ